MELSRRCRSSCVTLGLIVSAGCGLLKPAAVDPDINLAAHTVSRGIVIDQMDGGQSGTLVPTNARSGDAQFVLQTAAGTKAALWVNGSTTLVRQSPDLAAPLIGQVDASWEEGAIRFAVKPDHGGSFSTSLFKRTEGGASPSALGRP
ncbi:MAG: hypothetical protein ACRDL7_08230, partial [Gaiellaceae bacterium]